VPEAVICVEAHQQAPSSLKISTPSTFGLPTRIEVVQSVSSKIIALPLLHHTLRQDVVRLMPRKSVQPRTIVNSTSLILTDTNKDFSKLHFYQLVTQSHDYLQNLDN